VDNKAANTALSLHVCIVANTDYEETNYQMGALRINRELSSFLIHLRISLHALIQLGLDSSGPKVANSSKPEVTHATIVSD